MKETEEVLDEAAAARAALWAEENYPGNALTILQAIGTPREWDRMQVIRYMEFLGKVLPITGLKVCHSFSGAERCPSPDKLWEESVRLESPYPTPADVIAELLWKREHIGMTLRAQHPAYPDRPNIHALEGSRTPDFSHPLVAETVARVGGWKAICASEYVEGLTKQLHTQYEAAIVGWRDKVKWYLSSPPAQRPRKYFPRWVPWSAPSAWKEPQEVAPVQTHRRIAAKDPSKEIVPMPPELRAQFGNLRRMLASVGQEMPRERQETRQDWPDPFEDAGEREGAR